MEEQVSFLSCDGTTQVHAAIWWPEAEPVGVVQLVHGMAEHILRYAEFAAYLNDRGFVVCGHDHIGHGQSVRDRSEWGCMPAKGGRDVLVGDVGRLRALMDDKLDTRLPYFLFGHSMGSFVTRAYIAECATGLHGAVICGTGHVAPAVSAAGNLLARGIARIKGDNYVSGLLGNLSVGAYAKAVENPRTPLDWLSYNQDNVDTYIADEQCGFAFSAGGNATLTSLVHEVCTPACCARVLKDLPLLYIAGDADPVGDSGEGVRTAARMAREAGSRDVTCTIYEHMRHEILNEDGRMRVFDDVATWMEDHL